MTDTAIILAAGRGSRMCENTDQLPKAMLPLLGTPLLHWQLGALRSAGVKKVIVVGGYRHERLEGEFELVLNERWAETNMVQSLAVAAQWLCSEDCIISYSDIVYRPEHVRSLAAAECGLAITYDRDWRRLWEMRFADPLSDAESFRLQGDKLVDIGRRQESLDTIEGQYMGLLRFSPAGWAEVERTLASLSAERADRLDMTSLLSLLLARGVSVTAVGVAGGWCECDTPGDIKTYEQAILAATNDGTTWSHDWRSDVSRGI